MVGVHDVYEVIIPFSSHSSHPRAEGWWMGVPNIIGPDNRPPLYYYYHHRTTTSTALIEISIEI